ncbi:hypothetical protein [Lacrimispora defluvii]|uniref:Uncharacterized protein n=1 Tax=Lacrimispora defluvii TaxID=2719233 RepID=A0ABX1VQW7_9FIRM|nr:hypothetical protein [Lacrimispora defluvii]NNJ30823.1 hypothetical protein [Lacrimispora defluvii]
MNADIFPEQVLSLTEADIPIKGVKAYLNMSTKANIMYLAQKDRYGCKRK